MKRKEWKLFALKSLLLRKSGAFYLLTVLRTSKKTEGFEEIYVTLNKALNEYENLLLAGDLNINTNTKCKVKNSYVDFTGEFCSLQKSQEQM